jgi:hypothetical protein
MGYPSQPEKWSSPVGSPKQKYKFLVEFDSSSIIGQTFNQQQYKYLIKNITKPKPTMATLEATDQETRNWFGNTPDPTKRLQGSVSWSPITIKFVNQIIRTVNKGEEIGAAGKWERPDDEYPPNDPNAPGMSIPDLDHFFSRMVEDMDSSFFGGSAPKEFNFDTTNFYSTPQDAVTAYLNSLSITDRIAAAKKNFSDNWNDARTAGFKFNEPENYSIKNEDASTLDKSIHCKSSMDSFMKASCVFIKFFGYIKIYDLITNLPSNPDPKLNLSAATTFANGYWTLRNPFIKSIDFGNYDYSADDLVEYSLEIGYESARYVTLRYGT